MREELAQLEAEPPRHDPSVEPDQRLTRLSQRLEELQAAAAGCDPAGRLKSGRLAAVATQLRVLRQCAALERRLVRCIRRLGQPRRNTARRTTTEALNDTPAAAAAAATSAAETEDTPDSADTTDDVDDVDYIDEAEDDSSVQDDDSGPLFPDMRPGTARSLPLPLTAPRVDPLLSQIVTRALSGRFTAAASHAMAASLARDAHALLTRLERCPLRLLADVLAAHGYNTLHDLATLSATDASRVLGTVLQRLEAPGSNNGAASASTDEETEIGSTSVGSGEGAVATAAMAGSSATGVRMAGIAASVSLRARSTVGAASGTPHLSSSGGGSALMTAPLVSPIDRGVVVPDQAEVLGCVASVRYRFCLFVHV